MRPEDEDAYATSELVADAVDIITRYQGRRNILIGHSYGAALCVHLANKARSSLIYLFFGLFPNHFPVFSPFCARFNLLLVHTVTIPGSECDVDGAYWHVR